MVLQKIGEAVNKKPLAIVVGVIVITILMLAQMALNPQDGTVSQSSFLPDLVDLIRVSIQLLFIFFILGDSYFILIWCSVNRLLFDSDFKVI